MRKRVGSPLVKTVPTDPVLKKLRCFCNKKPVGVTCSVCLSGKPATAVSGKPATAVSGKPATALRGNPTSGIKRKNSPPEGRDSPPERKDSPLSSSSDSPSTQGSNGWVTTDNNESDSDSDSSEILLPSPEKLRKDSLRRSRIRTTRNLLQVRSRKEGSRSPHLANLKSLLQSSKSPHSLLQSSNRPSASPGCWSLYKRRRTEVLSSTLVGGEEAVRVSRHDLFHANISDITNNNIKNNNSSSSSNNNNSATTHNNSHKGGGLSPPPRDPFSFHNSSSESLSGLSPSKPRLPVRVYGGRVRRNNSAGAAAAGFCRGEAAATTTTTTTGQSAVQVYNRQEGVSNQRGEVSNQRGEVSNQRGKVSNQRGKVSNQTKQVSNQPEGALTQREEVSNPRRPQLLLSSNRATLGRPASQTTRRWRRPSLLLPHSHSRVPRESVAVDSNLWGIGSGPQSKEPEDSDSAPQDSPPRTKDCSDRAPRSADFGDSDRIEEFDSDDSLSGKRVDPANVDPEMMTGERVRHKRKSEEAILVVSDSEEFPPSSSSRVETRSRREAMLVSGQAIPLCKFGNVSVSTDDYLSLELGEFLNDNIIDFYLTYLHQNILAADDRDSVHVFSSQFFLRITSTPVSKNRSAEKGKSSEERRYSRVERWTKNIDLFSKDMVIFPICESSHWFLIIVVKPGLIQLPADCEDRKVRGEPFLLLLDSLGGNKLGAVNIVRQYLACEWKARKGSEESFSTHSMKLLKPRKPEQENFTDCGVYLLHYVEKIFGRVAQFYFTNLPDLSAWFPTEEIDRKRGELAALIQCLAAEQNNVEPSSLPPIDLVPEPRPPKKSRRPCYAQLDWDDKYNPDIEAGKSRLDSNNRIRPYRKTRNAHPVVDSDSDSNILGTDSSRLGDYKIPRRVSPRGAPPDSVSVSPTRKLSLQLYREKRRNRISGAPEPEPSGNRNQTQQEIGAELEDIQLKPLTKKGRHGVVPDPTISSSIPAGRHHEPEPATSCTSPGRPEIPSYSPPSPIFTSRQRRERVGGGSERGTMLRFDAMMEKELEEGRKRMVEDGKERQGKERNLLGGSGGSERLQLVEKELEEERGREVERTRSGREKEANGGQKWSDSVWSQRRAGHGMEGGPNLKTRERRQISNGKERDKGMEMMEEKSSKVKEKSSKEEERREEKCREKEGREKRCQEKTISRKTAKNNEYNPSKYDCFSELEEYFDSKSDGAKKSQRASSSRNLSSSHTSPRTASQTSRNHSSLTSSHPTSCLPSSSGFSRSEGQRGNRNITGVRLEKGVARAANNRTHKTATTGTDMSDVEVLMEIEEKTEHLARVLERRQAVKIPDKKEGEEEVEQVGEVVRVNEEEEEEVVEEVMDVEPNPGRAEVIEDDNDEEEEVEEVVEEVERGRGLGNNEVIEEIDLMECEDGEEEEEGRRAASKMGGCRAGRTGAPARLLQQRTEPVLFVEKRARGKPSRDGLLASNSSQQHYPTGRLRKPSSDTTKAITITKSGNLHPGPGTKSSSSSTSVVGTQESSRVRHRNTKFLEIPDSDSSDEQDQNVYQTVSSKSCAKSSSEIVEIKDGNESTKSGSFNDTSRNLFNKEKGECLEIEYFQREEKSNLEPKKRFKIVRSPKLYHFRADKKDQMWKKVIGLESSDDSAGIFSEKE